MAFLDNPTIILAHIRQSHVTSDDTGMCEMVLIDHDVDLEKFNPSSACGDNGAEPQGSNGDTQGYVYSQSVDITSSWDFGIRRRSNTAQRLERLRKERQNQIKCKNVQWKDRNTSCSAEELSSLFEKKNFRVKSPCSGKQSILSVRLEQCPLQLNNPFNEYSKFDGKSEESVSKNKELVLYPGWIVLLQLPGSSRASGPSHLSEQDHALKYISSPWDGVCTWQSAVNTSRPASGCFGGGFFPPGEGKGGSSPVAQKGVEPRGPGAFQSRAGLEELSCAWLCLRLRAARAL